MPDEIHVNDVGTIFRMTISNSGAALDLSAANTTSSRLFVFRKPDGTLTTQTTSFQSGSGTAGVLDFTAPSGFLDTAGDWRLQAYINLGSGGSFHTDYLVFTVYPNLT